MRIILLIILLLSCPYVGATQQIKDRLYFDGLDFAINELPLSSLPEIEEKVRNDNPARCSANWRGYQAGWLIQDNQLSLMYLTKNPCSELKEQFDISQYFQTESYFVNASWYTGSITIRISKKEFSQANSTYRYQAVVYEIQKGKVISRGVKYIEDKF